MNYYSILLCFALSIFNGQAQGFVEFGKAKVVRTTENPCVKTTLSFKILEGYHIQSESETLDNYIATEIRFEDHTSYEIISYEFTSRNYEKMVLDQNILNVLIGTFEVTVTLKLNEEKTSSNTVLSGQLYYQACTNRQCLFPRTLSFQVANI